MFQVLTYTQRYICLSTDTKSTSGVIKGSLAKETDTGKEFIFDGTAWIPYSQPITINGSLANVTHTPVSVGVVSTPVLVSNPNRKYLLLENDSDTDMYIFINGAAVVGQGIRLNANGGSYEMTAGNISTAAINGINNGVGNKNLLVTEGV